MKKFFSILLVCVLLAATFSGCDRRSTADDNASGEADQAVNFAPEATAITSQVTQQPEATANDAQPAAENAMAVASDEAVTAAADAAAAQPAATPTAEPAAAQPFATATPQPNTAVSGYSEISGTGLGFKFSYPNGWNNIPGRSTVCYVQPLDDGTVYPARVAVTMKKLAHKCNEEKAQTELAEYLKLLMSQYDEKTFEVSKNLDMDTKFMGSKAISTTYMAYDGKQEIQGYVIITWFEKYVFCYHFLSAYEDYAAFDVAMRHMRDSVQPVQSDFETED